MNDLTTARGLGWASLAIAATELIGRSHVERDLLGVDEHNKLMIALALREAAAGGAILSQRNITPTLAAGLWSRVAGDAMDIALLATAAPKTRNRPGFSASAIMVLGITALDVYCAWRVHRRLMRERSWAACVRRERTIHSFNA